MRRAYLDHNATSPLRPEARDAMIAAMERPGNASSIHAEGRAARAVIDEAREAIAGMIGCAPRQVIFTSGGTEANMMALSPHWLPHQHGPVRLFVSAIEHTSVLQGGQFAAGDIELLPVNGEGIVDLETAKTAFAGWHETSDGAPFLVSVMTANNETGAVQPMAAIAALAHEFGGLVHSDAVQAFGKLRLDDLLPGTDLLTTSAHKIGGPKGVGALAILRDGLPVAALLKGGGQEFGYRAGTENVAAIAGFGEAAKAKQDWNRIEALRDRLETEAARVSPELERFAHGSKRLPNTCCLAIPGMDAETILMGMDLAGVAVSAGSACSSGKVTRSHVLDAMGVAPETGAGAIRVSLGWNTSEDDIGRFIAAWTQIYGKFVERRRAA